MAAAFTPRRLVAAVLMLSCHAAAMALEPPTREELERYRSDGSIAGRVEAAYRTGNHLVAPHLVRRLGERFGRVPVKNEAIENSLQTHGNPRVFALLIEFSDEHADNSASEIDRGLYGNGLTFNYPYESLRNFYLRSSYDQLDIQGSTLGWYRTAYPRSAVEQTRAGREALVAEAIVHFDDGGHNFRQYDNNGDGTIDYFLVFYAGPPDGWGGFWWGQYTEFGDASLTVDGKRLGGYSFQWAQWAPGGPFEPLTAIHETGHALGLPDYYDYDDNDGIEGVGPRGGLGRLDMMDDNWGDHNAFSKFLLGWIEPTIVNEGAHEMTLMPSDAGPSAALLMHGDSPLDPYAEYFMVEYRRRLGNDSDIPTSGLVIWHIDARLFERGGFLYNNADTDHKLIRRMEADGLEEIEQGMPADAGDFYRPGDVFGIDTTPDSRRYDRAPTNLVVDAISLVDGGIDFTASLGSGCAVFCDAAAPLTAWPAKATHFYSSAELFNCGGGVSFDWRLDGDPRAGDDFWHAFTEPGVYEWSLQSELGDASCPRHGSLLVCSDARCWRWREEPAMEAARAGHSAIVLEDGRVLVVGGGGPPEVFDLSDGSWNPTGAIAGSFVFAAAARLEDGRVLAVGSSPADPVNAEIYDPDSDSWSLTGQLVSDRLLASAVRLDDGRVLVAGGCSFDATGECSLPALQAEVFDPQTEQWSEVGSVASMMIWPGLTLLEDGRVLITGDLTAKIFNPTADSLSPTSGTESEHNVHAAVRLHDGRVLVVGGDPSRRVEIFDPATQAWTVGAAMSESRILPRATVLDTGHVFVLGGADRRDTCSRTAEVYDPATDSWTLVEPMIEPRFGHALSVLADGSLLVTGGIASPATENPLEWVRSATVERFETPEVLLAPPRRPDGRIGATSP